MGLSLVGRAQLLHASCKGGEIWRPNEDEHLQLLLDNY